MLAVTGSKHGNSVSVKILFSCFFLVSSSFRINFGFNYGYG